MDDSSDNLQTRATLLFRLKDWRDEPTWAEFYGLYRSYIYSIARRAGLNHADAEDITQEVFRRVAETIHTFEADPKKGSFRSWLCQLTRWRILDKLRGRPLENRQWQSYSNDDDDARTRTIERLPAPIDSEAVWQQEWQQRLLEVALARVMRKTTAKHFQVFDLQRQQGWSVPRVARELNMNVATVYVITHRLRKILRSEIEILKLHTL